MKKNGKSRDIAPVEEQQYSFSICSGKQCADFSAQCCRKRGGGEAVWFPNNHAVSPNEVVSDGQGKGEK